MKEREGDWGGVGHLQKMQLQDKLRASHSSEKQKINVTQLYRNVRQTNCGKVGVSSGRSWAN